MKLKSNIPEQKKNDIFLPVDSFINNIDRHSPKNANDINPNHTTKKHIRKVSPKLERRKRNCECRNCKTLNYL